MRDMLSRWFWFDTTCAHEHTLVVRSVGVERTVCEECGHVSFTMRPENVDFQTAEKPRQDRLPHVSGL